MLEALALLELLAPPDALALLAALDDRGASAGGVGTGPCARWLRVSEYWKLGCDRSAITSGDSGEIVPSAWKRSSSFDTRRR